MRGPQSLHAALLGYRYGKGFAASLATDAAVAPRDANALETYFDAHTDGPGIWKKRHYFEVYEQHLAKFVGRDVHLVEIGVFAGGVLRCGRNYLGEGSQIYGVDLEPRCRIHEAAGIKVAIGDQASPSFWAGFRADVPRLDIVIDDGGHQPPSRSRRSKPSRTSVRAVCTCARTCMARSSHFIPMSTDWRARSTR